MARNKLLPAETQITLAKEYFESVCKGNISHFTFLGLSLFISEKTGIPVKEHVVRRCSEVREYYDYLQSESGIECFHSEVTVYKTLDIDAFLAQNSDIPSLRVALKQRDSYYQNLCSTAASISKQAHSLRTENRGLKEDVERLTREVEEQIATIQEQKNQLTESALLIKKMRDILESNVNAEIAVELLKEAGLLKESAENGPVLKNTAKEDFVITASDAIPNLVAKDKNAFGSRVIKGLFDKI